MEQLKTNVESVNIDLTDEVIKEINEVQTIYPNPCPIIKNFIIIIFVSLFSVSANSQEVKKVGKFKDWEAMVIVEQTGKVCFAQSVSSITSLQNLT